MCKGLQSTQIVGRPQEWFNVHTEARIRERWSATLKTADFTAYFRHIFQTQRTRNGVFGAKIHYFEFEKLPHRTLGMGKSPGQWLMELIPSAKFIWLKRKDQERQAISYWRGLRTGKWWKTNDALEMPPILAFDACAVHNLEGQLAQCDRGWMTCFRDFAIAPLVLNYEDLATNYADTLRHVIDWLGIPGGSNVTLMPPTLRKQADDQTEVWLQEYRAYKFRLHS